MRERCAGLVQWVPVNDLLDGVRALLFDPPLSRRGSRAAMRVAIALFDFLQERIGLDVTSVGPAIIERAVRQRTTRKRPTPRDWQLLPKARAMNGKR